MKAFAAAAAVSLSFTCAATAGADPVRITSGSLVFNGATNSFSRLTLAGTGGFTFTGGIGFGVFAPGDCIVPDCLSGSPLPLLGRWSGNDLGGTATFAGVTYAAVGSLSSNTAVSLEFDGTMFAPGHGSAAALRAPFTFTGLFFAESAPGMTTAHVLSGRGVALASVLRHAGTDAWRFERLEYRFGDAAQTPEPATLTLLATGGALAGWRLRARRRRHAPLPHTPPPTRN